MNNQHQESLNDIESGNLIQKPSTEFVKKYRNPFNIFMAENKDNYQNLGTSYLKEMASIWNSLDEEEKKIYVEKSNQEK